jgi:predicted Fe-S protein YdhL (DUF1289 family)
MHKDMARTSDYDARPMQSIHITDIETAINYWRQISPSPDGVELCAPLRALATVYALMIYHHEDEVSTKGFPPKAYEAWLTWYEQTPDTPCIAICSTSQGDAYCKGCGRTFEEVQYWTEMSPAEKRSTWRRITLEQSAWRFNRYAERASENTLSRASVPEPATKEVAKGENRAG